MVEKEIILTIEKKILSRIYKEVNKLILKRKKVKESHIIEIEVNDFLAEIKSTGLIVSVKCNSNFKGKLFIPYPVFRMAAEYATQKEVSLHISGNTLSFENKKYSAEKLTILSSLEEDIFELSMDYTPLELLSIRKKFPMASIERRNFLKPLEQEEEMLKRGVHEAIMILRRYEITTDDISEIIKKKIDKYL
ncbi:MAG: hypothetical protein LWX07_03845 [Bacteroidetes bacterium]|nr:hypothetical protein [Bacteroidota bacterium]